MTKRQFAYSQYLKSDHWLKLRDAVIKRDGAKCVACGSRFPLTAHHKFYRRRFEDSLESDLITLCIDCHEKEHKIERDGGGKIVSIQQMPGQRARKPSDFRKLRRKHQRRLKRRRKWLENFRLKKERLGWSF